MASSGENCECGIFVINRSQKKKKTNFRFLVVDIEKVATIDELKSQYVVQYSQNTLNTPNVELAYTLGYI
jgi:hypothetical protein